MHREAGMKRALLALSLGLLFLVMSAIHVARAQEPQEITVITDDRYPPYLFRNDEGALQGLVKDKWELWSRYTGVRVELRGTRWAEAQHAVRTGAADVVDLLAYTPQRTREYELSSGRLTVEARLYFHRSLTAIHDADSLRGLLVGVKQASACGDYLRAHGVRSLRAYPDSEAIVAAAAQGDVRVFCMDSPVANYLLYQHGVDRQFKESPAIYSAPLHWATGPGRVELRNLVQAGFDRIPRNELDRLEAKWLGSTVRAPLDVRVLWALGMVPVALLVLSGVLAIWKRCLRLRIEARARLFATSDSLTGLPTRHLLNDRLSQAIADATRNHRVVGVLFVDLDRFKAVNDTYGHERGDRVLKEAAMRLLSCTRATDTVARISSDEFVVILTGLVRSDDAGIFARKVLEELHRPFDLAGQQVYCTASIGIAIHPGDGVSAADLIRNADIAMYRAKERGRNNFQYFLPEMHEQAVRRVHLETALRGALQRGEFQIHYQPRTQLETGEVTGFEALLRWQHPHYGLLPPSEFIPILEDTDLIVPVGEWVLDDVCKQIAAWQAQGLAVRPVAVNLSARQFRMAGLDHAVAAIITQAGIDPSLIEVELTESLLMTDPEEAVRTLGNLERYGVRLAVDDFGTGYSSLMYLKRFPINALKIDRAFISDATTNPEDAAITAAIINLGHSLGLKVVAEGVENEGQREFLRASGCDEMQGFLFSPAVPAADAGKMLRAAPRRDAA
jgi:diguanylate cyclase (GGDEF)-like protein